VTSGKTKIAGIKIHDTRMMRLMEAPLHGAYNSMDGDPPTSVNPFSPLSAWPPTPTASPTPL
jgi:hypothetical protein